MIIIYISIKLVLPRSPTCMKYVWRLANTVVQPSRKISNDAGLDLWATLSSTSSSLKDVSNCHISGSALPYANCFLQRCLGCVFLFLFHFHFQFIHGDKWGTCFPLFQTREGWLSFQRAAYCSFIWDVQPVVTSLPGSTFYSHAFNHPSSHVMFGILGVSWYCWGLSLQICFWSHYYLGWPWEMKTGPLSGTS